MAIITVTEANFEEEVLRSEVPVLLDFWASWCGPCRMLSPIVDEVAAETEGVKVGKVNVDEEEALARRFKIFSIPTLMVFKGGEAVKTSVGLIGKEEVQALIAF